MKTYFEKDKTKIYVFCTKYMVLSRYWPRCFHEMHQVWDFQEQKGLSDFIFMWVFTGDSLSRHSNKAFTTRDRDNDDDSGNCAIKRTGAWWYDDCTDSNLNGRRIQQTTWEAIVWHRWKSNNGLSKSKMKMRPVTRI